MPDPSNLKEYVASGAGYLQGGLQRENWERATLAIVKMSSKKISHPAINYLIKHVGCIFRRLFLISFRDLRVGSSVASKKLNLLPPCIETYLVTQFDNMVWNLMEKAADKIHISLEPMYSILDPGLPTFVPIETDSTEERYIFQDGCYQRVPLKEESQEQGILGYLKSKVEGILTLDDGKAKELMRVEGRKKACEKKSFLPDERTRMINDLETDQIIMSAFRYTMALRDQIMIFLNFQINHYLYQDFKERVSNFARFVLDEDWSNMIPKDERIDHEIYNLEDKISGLQGSLQEVQRLQNQLY